VLKRPTSRRKGHSGQIELNLVPMLDTLVTLIAFLLYTMTFLDIVGIESPFPIASTEHVEQKLKEKPLQLTVSLRENEAAIWSPFQRITTKTIPNPAPGLYDLHAIHEALIEVKKQFPTETHVVVVPTGGTNYDTLVAVMDTLRNLDATDPPIFVKNAQTGLEEQAKLLFPDVIFGNLLGDG
jgi:biopolymer transport protein ExbD